mmetsp:Transcript_2926/g.6704  ORF Transcript_2926/g.6704 Transcript_2926/m.6704 type:complete len:267 (+) Transcript_2926:309-1109(+)
MSRRGAPYTTAALYSSSSSMPESMCFSSLSSVSSPPPSVPPPAARLEAAWLFSLSPAGTEAMDERTPSSPGAVAVFRVWTTVFFFPRLQQTIKTMQRISRSTPPPMMRPKYSQPIPQIGQAWVFSTSVQSNSCRSLSQVPPCFGSVFTTLRRFPFLFTPHLGQRCSSGGSSQSPSSQSTGGFSGSQGFVSCTFLQSNSSQSLSHLPPNCASVVTLRLRFPFPSLPSAMHLGHSGSSSHSESDLTQSCGCRKSSGYRLTQPSGSFLS